MAEEEEKEDTGPQVSEPKTDFSSEAEFYLQNADLYHQAKMGPEGAFPFEQDDPPERQQQEIDRRKAQALDNNKNLDEYMNSHGGNIFKDVYTKDPRFRPSAEEAFNVTKRLKQLYEQGDPATREMIDNYEDGIGKHPYGNLDPKKGTHLDDQFKSKTYGTLTNDREYDTFSQVMNTLLKDKLYNERDTMSIEDATDIGNVSDFDVIGRPFMEMPPALIQRLQREFPRK